MKCPYCPASYSTEGEVHRHIECSGCRDRFESRARAIRAVVAAQWIELIVTIATIESFASSDAVQAALRVRMVLPTPEQIVDGVL